jgi:hypothetical protein
MTIEKASAELKLPNYYYSHWKKMLDRVDEIEKSDGFIPRNISSDSQQIHPGRISSLEEI